MARTPGSGWGGNPIKWTICPHCKRKKAFRKPIPGAEWHKPYKCTFCKERSDIKELPICPECNVDLRDGNHLTICVYYK